MTRRPKESLKDFAAQIEHLSLDDLNDLRLHYGREHENGVRAANVARRKLDTIKNVMFIRKNGGAIGITDHAVLRYLERHKGVDVRAARAEIQRLAIDRKLIIGTEGHYDANGVTVVIPQGSVVATVLPKNGAIPTRTDPPREDAT